MVLVRTAASSYKKCTDQVLSEIMVRMGGSYSIDVQSMVEILRKVLPKRKDVDRHMVFYVAANWSWRPIMLRFWHIILIHLLLRIINLILIIIVKVSCSI